ncbi:hypothetical protein [Chitinivibrio alkaliphilus]|uniref:Uncharacterized protein n=1 Tax=Chitinivibrio alkaliphilus ACht1 TaxID=1313304 RepID=U7DCV4_9BACT|nr:hypothetical protein [Chitinivibrio alkaliphilus]ERP38731.1 hypothetical protein CALK_0749 [Chitinivibrio alkaliphilus ACht1]
METHLDILRDASQEAEEILGITERFVANGLDGIQITPKASAADVEKIKGEITKIVKQRVQSVRHKTERYRKMLDEAAVVVAKLEEKRFHNHRDQLKGELEHLASFFTALEAAPDKIKAAGKAKLLDIKKNLHEMERRKMYSKIKKNIFNLP